MVVRGRGNKEAGSEELASALCREAKTIKSQTETEIGVGDIWDGGAEELQN